MQTYSIVDRFLILIAEGLILATLTLCILALLIAACPEQVSIAAGLATVFAGGWYPEYLAGYGIERDSQMVNGLFEARRAILSINPANW